MLFGRKAKLGWKGEKHELTVTMELVEAIDEEVNVLATAIELDKGGIPKITLVSKLYAVLLSGAGVSVTKEDVYESIMSSPADSADLVAAARYVLQLCFPQLETSERTTGKKQKG
jgi:hypothetical protein